MLNGSQSDKQRNSETLPSNHRNIAMELNSLWHLHDGKYGKIYILTLDKTLYNQHTNKVALVKGITTTYYSVQLFCF